jgi:outer membrane protein assembly factor BamD
MGCKKPKAPASPAGGKTAAQLLEAADILLQNAEWEGARQALRQIEEYYPSSPEYPRAKLLLGDSFFYGSTTSYPEALVEYNSFLNYFPRDSNRDYVLYRVALCHYGSIENAERDQSETRKALEGFQTLLREAPGSVYAVDAKAKVTQCWRRLAEAELLVGIHYIKSYAFTPGERRLKELLETYPEYVDRERVYYYLGEALRQKPIEQATMKAWQKDYLAKVGVEDLEKLNKDQMEEFVKAVRRMVKDTSNGYVEEAKGYYKKLVESYPTSEWAGKASDRLLEMGQAGLKEELDS